MNKRQRKKISDQWFRWHKDYLKEARIWFVKTGELNSKVEVFQWKTVPGPEWEQK